MSYSTQEPVLGTISVATSATQYSDVWDALDLTQGVIQATWKDLTHADGTVTLQYSLDGTNYSNYTTATTMSSTPGAKFWEVTILGRFYRVAVSKVSNTAGTVSVRAIGKHT